MKLNPQWEFLILTRELKEKTDGGIIIPDDYQKRNLENIGIVESVGPDAEDWVKKLVGHEVVFKQHGGNWLYLNDLEFFTIHQDDILATVEQ